MQHYGITNDATILTIGYNSSPTQNYNSGCNEYILKNYAQLLVTLCGAGHINSAGETNDMEKCDRRYQRTKPIKKFKRNRKLPQIRLKKQFESAFFFTMDTHNDVLFTCPICRNILDVPVTVECGHSFCLNCLNFVATSKCVVCLMEIVLDKGVDVLVQNLVEKWRERNKNGNSNLNTTAILGIGPRYHLRSRFAGLQINKKTDSKVNAINLESFQTITKYTNTKLKKTITTFFREVKNIKEKAIKCNWNSSITLSDFECILCSRSLLDPVTTSCGHTFCRGCLTRVLDHGLNCPLCMASLSVKDYSRGTNVVLNQAISYLFPIEYSDRIFCNIQEVQLKSSDIPVFICTNAFPGVACPLFVYEPRYRLLVRRCLLSPKRRFAMAAKGETDGEKFVTFGTVLHVKDAVLLEDGSYILTTIGVTRFKVVNRGEQDGYDTATVQTVKDVAVSIDKLPELITLHQKVYSKALKWIQSLNSRILDEVKRLIGHMPKVEQNWYSLPDGPTWMWWLMPILPISSQLQIGFLSSINLEKRLKAIDKMFDRIEIRMKALDLSSSTEAEDLSEFCSEATNRPFDLPFNVN